MEMFLCAGRHPNTYGGIKIDRMLFKLAARAESEGLHLPRVSWERWDKLVVLLLFACTTRLTQDDEDCWTICQTILFRLLVTGVSSLTLAYVVKAYRNRQYRASLPVTVDATTQTDDVDERLMTFVDDVKRKERGYQREIRRMQRHMMTLRKKCSLNYKARQCELARISRKLCEAEKQYEPLQLDVTSQSERRQQLEERLFIEKVHHRDVLARIAQVESDVVRDRTPRVHPAEDTTETRDFLQDSQSSQSKSGDDIGDFRLRNKVTQNEAGDWCGSIEDILNVQSMGDIDKEFCATQ